MEGEKEKEREGRSKTSVVPCRGGKNVNMGHRYRCKCGYTK